MDKALWTGWDRYVRHRHALKAAADDGEPIQLASPAGGLKPDQALDWLYQLLGILDAKASALMRLNGISLAAALVLAGQATHIGMSDFGPVSRVVTMVVALLSAVSILCCLFVVNVSWKFLDRVDDTGQGGLRFSREMRSLQNAGNFRQFMYRAAWWVSLLASVMFAVVLLCQVLPMLTAALHPTAGSQMPNAPTQ